MAPDWSPKQYEQYIDRVISILRGGEDSSRAIEVPGPLIDSSTKQAGQA